MSAADHRPHPNPLFGEIGSDTVEAPVLPGERVCAAGNHSAPTTVRAEQVPAGCRTTSAPASSELTSGAGDDARREIWTEPAALDRNDAGKLPERERDNTEAVLLDDRVSCVRSGSGPTTAGNERIADGHSETEGGSDPIAVDRHDIAVTGERAKPEIGGGAGSVLFDERFSGGSGDSGSRVGGDGRVTEGDGEAGPHGCDEPTVVDRDSVAVTGGRARPEDGGGDRAGSVRFGAQFSSAGGDSGSGVGVMGGLPMGVARPGRTGAVNRLSWIGTVSR